MPKTNFEQDSRSTRWHQSGLELLTDGCARQWGLEYEAGLSSGEKVLAVPGSAYHSAVEHYELARMNGEQLLTLDDMKQITSDYIDEAEPRLPERELNELEISLGGRKKATGLVAVKAQAAAAVEIFWDRPLADEGISVRELLSRWQPLALEAYMNGPVVPGARDLGGTVDGIYLDEYNTVRLVDHKSAKSLSYWKEIDEHAAQAAHYSTLALLHGKEVFGVELKQLPVLDFIVVRKDPSARLTTTVAKRLTYEPDPYDVVALRERVLKAEQIIAEQQFLPNPGYRWCRPQSCAFYDACQLGERKLSLPWAELKETI